MGNEQQNDSVNHADRLPTLLAINNPILDAERQGVLKNRHGCLKADLMLKEVSAVLLLIPFKSHSMEIISRLYIHYCTYRSDEVQRMEDG